MAEEVSIEVEEAGKASVVKASGYLDLDTSPRLRELIWEVADGGSRVVLVDLSAVEFLDSSALGVILSGWKHLNSLGGRLGVLSPNERVSRLFELTALNLSIDIYPSMEEAAQALGV